MNKIKKTIIFAIFIIILLLILIYCIISHESYNYTTSKGIIVGFLETESDGIKVYTLPDLLPQIFYFPNIIKDANGNLINASELNIGDTISFTAKIPKKPQLTEDVYPRRLHLTNVTSITVIGNNLDLIPTEERKMIYNSNTQNEEYILSDLQYLELYDIIYDMDAGMESFNNELPKSQEQYIFSLNGIEYQINIYENEIYIIKDKKRKNIITDISFEKMKAILEEVRLNQSN